MRRVSWTIIAAALLLAVCLYRAGAQVGGSATHDEGAAFQRPGMQGARVPCTQVMSKVHQHVRLTRGHAADISEIAKQLGTSVPWVERCMLAYGRRAERPGQETAEAREERLESFEEDEPEEAGLEDIQEPGAREREEHPQKERQLRIKPPPTPELSEEFREGYER